MNKKSLWGRAGNFARIGVLALAGMLSGCEAYSHQRDYPQNYSREVVKRASDGNGILTGNEKVWTAEELFGENYPAYVAWLRAGGVNSEKLFEITEIPIGNGAAPVELDGNAVIKINGVRGK